MDINSYIYKNVWYPHTRRWSSAVVRECYGSGKFTHEKYRQPPRIIRFCCFAIDSSVPPRRPPANPHASDSLYRTATTRSPPPIAPAPFHQFRRVLSHFLSCTTSPLCVRFSSPERFFPSCSTSSSSALVLRELHFPLCRSYFFLPSV